MGSYRSKEDDVARISTSKTGKRFGFVRFINVFNEERLVNNLCMVWSGQFKLQANIARFQRTLVNGNINFTKDEGGFMGKNSHMNKKDNGNFVAKESMGSGDTYVQVMKGDVKTGGRETESIPVVFLDDECLMSNDFSMSLLGRVKDFASLANLKVALCNEGFVNIKIKYMGELWVLLEFVIRESIKLFRDNVSVGSWVSQIIKASRDFVTNGRIAWVEIEGVPFKLWSHNTFKKIADRWGKLLDVDDQEETWYHSKRLCIHTKSDEEDQEDDMSNDGGAKEHIPGGGRDGNEQEDDLVSGFKEEKQADNNVEDGDMDDQENKSEDPFQIYKFLHKNNKVDRNEGVSDDSLKYPPGFTPYGSGGIRVNGISKANSAEFGMSGHFKTSSLPRTGGSIMGILDEVVKVGQVMGYNMEGVLFCHVEGCLADDWAISSFDRSLRSSRNRYGSKFNAHSAMVFNSFILNSGLVEVSLGVCSFTWCHKTATKMSKLDRFLMSESFLNSCPNINAITLERYLSDHRPILLRDAHVDYGPTPFRFFHYWLEMEGFPKMVEDGWRDSPCDRSNALRNLTGKLKHLKNDIRVWNKTKDNGNGTMEDIKRRKELVNKLQDIDKLHALEMAQKAKVKWAVEGDESSSFFHDRKRDLEGEVTNDEIKKDVWDWGTDKALGPDGFTFGLFQGLQLGGSVKLSHMFFADDVIFVGQWSEESCKLITVGRKLTQSSLIDSFRRSPRGGAEQQQYNDLEDMVTATILALMSNRLVWSLESSGEFTVASVQKLIDDKWLPGADNKTRWIIYVPIKINVHAWKVKSDSIPTRFNISRREISIDSLSCVLCENEVETSNHFFFPVALSDKC
uniref:Nucleotide-binding alpha-beta plait domain-containing protein n=1 Tax=Tanacetum cinerariifolium TaxID=118510 RepID=A0A6L2MTX8_TANCI|nr:nucleotide-binding alpha-beta plait domain-containing protein [Tanacetum cinerariifolium]